MTSIFVQYEVNQFFSWNELISRILGKSLQSQHAFMGAFSNCSKVKCLKCEVNLLKLKTHSKRSFKGTPILRPRKILVSNTASTVRYCGSSSGRQISISVCEATVKAPIKTNQRPIDIKTLKNTNL